MPSSDYSPALTDIGAKLRARTVDQGGAELGTFTVNTRPTAAETLVLADQAVRDLAMVIGSDIPDDEDIRGAATDLAAIGTAMKIEMSYFPEQINTGRSPYPQLLEEYMRLLGILQEAITSAGEDGDVDADDVGGTGMAQFYFPEREIVGFDTNM